MYDIAVLWAWAEFAVRWTHVVTAIAWIGSSFYFIALDLGLRKDRPLPDGVTGEEWQAIQDELRINYERIQTLIKSAPAWPTESEIAGAIAVVAHSAYHLGEIRQALCILRTKAE